MNLKKRTENRRTAGYSLRHGYKNVLKCSGGNSESPQHRETKFRVCELCWERGIDFYTEVSFDGGGRADVVLSDYLLGIEVLATEEIKKFLTKKYPLPTIPIPANCSGAFLRELFDEIANLGNDEVLIEHYRKEYITVKK
jgi:hypothetical protein